jgi:DNA recombination protein RmuC
LQQDPELIEAGVGQRVLITSPTSLIALLRSGGMAGGRKIGGNARHISDLGWRSYDRLAKLAEHFGKVGKELEQAVKAYNQAVASVGNEGAAERESSKIRRKHGRRYDPLKP